jgi:soluble lytic murein transglycosylase-like protein
MDKTKGARAWLVLKSGPQAGTRHALSNAITRVGRASSNDIVLTGEEAAVVSSRHLEIHQEDDGYRICDLNSTNGTYIDQQRVTEAKVNSDTAIFLGSGGPQIFIEWDALASEEVDQTVILPAASAPDQPMPIGNPPAKEASAAAVIGSKHEEMLSDAVQRARKARQLGSGDQTAIIMREMLGSVLRSSKRKFRWTTGFLVLALASLGAYSAWEIRHLKKEKSNIDEEIRAIEARLSTGTKDAKEIDQLVEKLGEYEQRARSLQTNLFYRLGVRDSQQDFVESEIQQLMAEFGAEEYSIPPEFVTQVNRFIRQYQERDRPHMERALGRARPDLDAVRAAFRSDNLPPDLAYMVLVESAFIKGNESSAGAAGLWQFTDATARAYGLRVDETVDERLNSAKSTRAACRYIRELILDFGTGSSVMLALAAYNLGPGKVKQAVRKVDDPIQQRNFWYLYRVRALPQETREYVPKIIAVIIIGRNPERFKFA